MADITTLNDFSSITKVYTEIHKNILSESLIGIATFIALLVIIKKFINAYKAAFSDTKPADVKHFFELFHIYIYTIVIIISAPVAFSVVEKGLSKMQDEYVNKFSGDVDMSVDKAVQQYETNYVNEELKDSDNSILTEALATWWASKTEWFYTALLYATKYTFFFFAAGRYLYLLLLEIVAPLAVVCFLDDSIRQH